MPWRPERDLNPPTMVCCHRSSPEIRVDVDGASGGSCTPTLWVETKASAVESRLRNSLQPPKCSRNCSFVRAVGVEPTRTRFQGEEPTPDYDSEVNERVEPPAGVAPTSAEYQTAVPAPGTMALVKGWGDRRESNPFPLGHNQRCLPLHHGHSRSGRNRTCSLLVPETSGFPSASTPNNPAKSCEAIGTLKRSDTGSVLAQPFAPPVRSQRDMDCRLSLRRSPDYRYLRIVIVTK